ncbi:MAG: GNAT family N-acetyltransferase [Cyanobacteria bacterium J06641_5]
MTHTLSEQEALMEVNRWGQGLAMDLNWHRDGDRLHVFFARTTARGGNPREDLIARVCRTVLTSHISSIRFYEYQKPDARILWVRDVPFNPQAKGQGPIQIRPATPGDRPRLIAIQAAAIDVQCRPHYTTDQTRALLASKATFRHAGERVFVAIAADSLIGEVIVGFIALSRHGGFVQGLFVDPLYFRQGIGCQLLACAEAEALLAKQQQLWVMSALNAVAFYQAQGFARLETCDVVARGHRIPTVSMRKPLIPLNFPTRATHTAVRKSQDLQLLGWLAFGWATALVLAMLGILVAPLWVLAVLLALGFWGSSRVN